MWGAEKIKGYGRGYLIYYSSSSSSSVGTLQKESWIRLVEVYVQYSFHAAFLSQGAKEQE